MGSSMAMMGMVSSSEKDLSLEGVRALEVGTAGVARADMSRVGGVGDMVGVRKTASQG